MLKHNGWVTDSWIEASDRHPQKQTVLYHYNHRVAYVIAAGRLKLFGLIKLIGPPRREAEGQGTETIWRQTDRYFE